MSDELKPCPFCGGEAKFQIFDTTCNVECQQCGIGTRNELLDNYQVCVYKWNRSADDNLNADVTNLKSDEISLMPDMDERGADSREKLEADLEDMVRSWCADDTGVKATRGAIMYWRVKELLDRQAAITEREVKERVDFSLITQTANALFPDYQERIDELTAERDLWNERARQSHDYALELTAERDELKAKLETYGKVPDQGVREELSPVESGDTRENLKADIYSYLSESGTKPADAPLFTHIIGWLDRQAAITTAYCTSEGESCCEACRAAQKRKIAELTAEVEQLKRANRIQAESFKKLEQELKEAKDAVRGSHDDDKPGDEKAEG